MIQAQLNQSKCVYITSWETSRNTMKTDNYAKVAINRKQLNKSVHDEDTLAKEPTCALHNFMAVPRMKCTVLPHPLVIS